MRTVKIQITTIDQIKGFINDVSRISEDMDIRSGRHIIDAKSIMGLFSLNLSHPIDLIIYSEDSNRISDICAALKEYIVE